ncbi:hypothetical protein BU25DRAFT_422776 [Macroventuria anomochaeta]|uniref:Uncharacterized protein n=1 Tax=Macroventuria anomochaeta TaxID=301207 RepID=A0ACB6RZB2_9PLEO|nr:uncharacterized protein BU25DRAFT_422776 [Macroventuria anomochaeta]KAF2626212.1 hypothetical protein BU25DRAFT_422776 [Macroventuria anomochaeta]
MKFVADCLANDAYKSCQYGDPRMLWVGSTTENIACAIYTTRFSLEFRESGEKQATTAIDLEWKDSAYDGASEALSQALGTLLGGAIGPLYTYIGGQNGNTFRTAALGTARTRIMETMLGGLIWTAFTWELGDTIAELPAEDRELVANRTFAEMLEELSRSQKLSTFSSEGYGNLDLYTPEVQIGTSALLEHNDDRQLLCTNSEHSAELWQTQHPT